MASSYSRSPRRGRGGRGGPNTYHSTIDRRDLTEGLAASPLQTLTKPSVVTDEDIKVEEVAYLGSYNWIEANKPTILVPGSPNIWINKPPPFSVPSDSGINFVDQNGYRIPSTPLLPLFRAVDVVAESQVGSVVDWSSIDVVTDRNGLRKLFRWANHDETSSGPTPKDFRIDMQLAGDRTVLFNRWEPFRTVNANSWSFGYSFEKASTRPEDGCEEATGHHRIVKCELGDLAVVIRFEVDACKATPQTKDPKPKRTAGNTLAGDLSDLLSGLSVAQKEEEHTLSSEELRILKAGKYVAQDSVVEMTTRSERNAAQFDWDDAYPQLFLSHTTNHFLAVHTNGRFTRIEQRNLDSPEMRGIGRRMQPAFRRLKAVLEAIQELVVLYGKGGRLSLVCQGGVLKVYKRSSTDSFLPDDILARFDI